ncbi:MAG: MBOAT family O-acyltransferase [Lachnospiraceae bacterium]|nr:MBOAT family O-acyltransferase [Lachnospiraceae bacterium]
MLFNSYQYFVFFPIVVTIYFLIPQKYRWIWLLAASYYFYMSWNPVYALLIAGSTVITWRAGILINHEETIGRKKVVLAISCILNLGILFYFKYFNFLITQINIVADHLHTGTLDIAADIILPVGISFYTFQAVGYTIDVFRGEITAEKKLFRYALYVSFFPQLVAGPIERSRNLLPQLQKPTRFSFANMNTGLIYMGLGYLMKLVIADNAAVVVNTVYGNIELYSGWYLVVATILFAFQIYCDFGGYSLIAIGSAKVLGFDLMENFYTPYLSRNPSEFWRRWHISLSSWFRDYVYIPLGGNRKGEIRRCLNLMCVFTLSGLWHGASWHFVIWGGY